MSFEPVTVWNVRCDGGTSHGQCRELWQSIDCEDDDGDPFDVQLDKAAFDEQDRRYLKNNGWLLLRNDRLLCPKHVAAGMYMADAELYGLPFNDLATFWVREAFRLAERDGWVAFGSHVDQPGIALEFDGEDESGLPVWERSVRQYGERRLEGDASDTREGACSRCGCYMGHGDRSCGGRCGGLQVRWPCGVMLLGHRTYYCPIHNEPLAVDPALDVYKPHGAVRYHHEDGGRHGELIHIEEAW